MFRGAQAKKRRGTALVLYTVLLPTTLLFCGLAIDLCMLYVVQTRLSSAVDGAALGAGRLLGTTANTSEIAGEFLNANYPSGYWGSYNLTPSISVTNNSSLHTVAVSATVQVPLLFLRLLRQQYCTVAASATAVRRDVRVELVLDRSYSMIDQMSNLRTAATTFVNMFNPGTDELGLVILSGSSFVAYPTSEMPNYSLTSGTGPDVHFADSVTGSNQNMLTLISALQLGSDTNTSEAIWLAYMELKKAAAIDSDPTKANVIVLFTDGVPNGFTSYLNNPSSNALGSNSNCKYDPATSSSSTQMNGWIAAAGTSSTLSFFSPTNSTGIGFFNSLIFDTVHSSYYWVTNVGSGGYVDDLVEVTGTPMTNCSHIGGYGSLGSGTDMSGLATIPSQDYYGNSTSGTAYTQGVLYQQYGIAYNSSQPTNGYQMGLASWNVADNAAQKILSDSNMNVAIYTIGFTGDGGVDAVLLNRMANTQSSSSYNSSYQTGMYVEASDAASMQQAFGQVASEVLRLAH
jgi:Flp pilus assembly protein TadG